MSDLAAAAAAMGLPEPLVERSAEARSAESGASVEDLLAAWAGGETAPTPAAASEPPAESAPAEPEQPPDEGGVAPATPEIVIPVSPPAPAASSAPAEPYKAPVMVGTKDNPMTVLAGVVGLFVIVVLVGLIGPSIPFDSPGARSSDIAFSAAAIDGRTAYQTTGCAACHTQMVRPVIADVGLGPVTLDDTNQVLGSRRFGPDLADVGFRLTGSQIEAIIGGLGAHPAHSLSSTDLDNLVAYLVESNTSPPEGEES